MLRDPGGLAERHHMREGSTGCDGGGEVVGWRRLWGDLLEFNASVRKD
jgi:hypothetical protein